MHRLTAALLAASMLSLLLIGLLVSAPVVRGSRFDDSVPHASKVTIYMSTEEDGLSHSNFLSNTNQLWAVVEHEDAANDAFMVRLRDLSGITVFGRTLPPLNGDGKVSTLVEVEDFVDSYERLVGEQREPISESIDEAADWCVDPPDAPDPWPPVEPTPGPGPSPTPDPYSGWSEAMLTTLEQARSSSAELTRTLQAMMTLPDAQTEIPDTYADLGEARAALSRANGLLTRVPQLLRPSAPPSPTPVPGRPTPTPAPVPQPDPQQACNLVEQAKTEIDNALGGLDAALAGIPEDVSAWRLPGTSARYDDDGKFVGCLQYKTDLLAMVGGQPRTTPADSATWTLGDPGEPAMMFPRLELVDPDSLGQLGLRFPEGITAMYSRKVVVDSANHEAQLSTFVTDDNCIPVSDTMAAMWTAPITRTGGAVVEPENVMLEGGAGEATLRAGDEGTGDFSSQIPKLGAFVYACAGPACQPGMPTPEPGNRPPGQVWGSHRFEVIGTASVSTTRLIIQPDTINRREDQVAYVTLQVHDRSGQAVAAGTMARVYIPEDDPGLLAQDRVKLVGGRPSGQTERQVLGKSADLVVGAQGFAALPPSEDPGYQNGSLYIFAGDTPDGKLAVCYEADDASACEEDAVEIVTRMKVFIPVTYQGYDVRAEPTYLPPSVQRNPR